jgi:5,10-methylenetetrahydromethanopterin reductase
MTEVWLGGTARPGQLTSRIGVMARDIEAHGAHGWWTADSPAFGLDPYVALSLAAQSTTSLRLGVFATNSFSRHPMVTAAAAASLHFESRGRFLLGIGRGDSALAHLGLGPTPVAAFERYAETVNRLLRGEEVPFTPVPGMPPLEALGYQAGPSATRISWLPNSGGKVPVAIAASGPKMMSVAGRQADRVLLGVGCDEGRVKWAIDRVRAAAADSGRDPQSLRIMLQTVVGISDEPATARSLAGPRLAAQMRFSAMQGRPSGALSEADKDAMEAARSSYDMSRHGQRGNRSTGGLNDDFIERHAVTGSAREVLHRLERLTALGVDGFVLVYGGAPEREWIPADRAIVESIIPGLATAAEANP